jgi:predicted RNA-binding Zn-ribbon protein involved in translation (DUF1610 family)/WD40 repeat protein
MSNEFYKAQVFECPSCGASLSLPDADSFHCDYCGKLIEVPPKLRPHRPKSESMTPAGDSVEPDVLGGQKTASTSFDIGTIKQKSTQRIMILAICVSVLIMGAIGLLLAVIPSSDSSSSNESSEIQLRTTPLPTMVQFARLAMVFGSQGNQPGQFEDARSIAVDDQGNIFVADYTSGRINKFDSQGNFLQLIQVKSAKGNEDVYIFDIAADANDNLYVACDGNILKYNTSGELLLTIHDQWPDIYFETVVVAPDGNLYSTNGMAGADDVIILNPQGEVLAHWVDTIESVNHDDPSIELALDVNHSGMVYILSPFGNKVYGYNPDGTFNFSFGEEGERAGQFNLSIGMLAITEQDYLVISDVYRVDLFDKNGNYLGKTFTIDYQVAGGSMFNMTIDSQGELYYISSGGKVLKYDMNYP